MPFKKTRKKKITFQLLITITFLINTTKQRLQIKSNPGITLNENHHLFSSKKFDLDSLSSNNFFFIELTDHIRLHHTLKTQYIYDLLHKYKGDVLEIRTLTNENITNLMNYEILFEANHSFAEGIIPVHIIQKNSYEGFKANVKVKHFQNWTRMDTEADKVENEKAAKVEKPAARIIQATGSTLMKDAKFIETTYFMSSWLIPDYAKMLFSLIAIALKSLVTLIQFFLVFVRPCITHPNSLLHDWTISFASTLMWIQSYLFIGLLSQNFGGALNHPINEMMRTSRSIFSERFDKEYLESIFDAEKKYKGAGYWDLAINGYVPSPILENWLGSILLLASMIAVLILRRKYKKNRSRTRKKSRLYVIAREIQIGVLLSFMIPLNVSSINCIFATFKSGIFDFVGILSFLFSLYVLLHYAWFVFDLCRKNPFKNGYKRYYSHMNFDLPSFYSRLVIPYVEYLSLYLLIVIQTIFANQHFFPLAFSVFMQGFLLVILMSTPGKTYDFKELSRINLWKKINIFLKTLLLTVIFIFLYFNDKMSLQFVKIFTIFSLLIMFIIFLGHCYVLYLRLAGAARRGIGDSYPDLVESQNNYRELDMDLSRDSLENNRNPGFSGFNKRSNFMQEFGTDFKRSRKSRLSEDRRRGQRSSWSGWDDWDYDYGGYLERSQARSNRSRLSRNSSGSRRSRLSEGGRRSRLSDGGRRSRLSGGSRRSRKSQGHGTHYGYLNMNRDF